MSWSAFFFWMKLVIQNLQRLRLTRRLRDSIIFSDLMQMLLLFSVVAWQHISTTCYQMKVHILLVFRIFVIIFGCTFRLKGIVMSKTVKKTNHSIVNASYRSCQDS